MFWTFVLAILFVYALPFLVLLGLWVLAIFFHVSKAMYARTLYGITSFFRNLFSGRLGRKNYAIAILLTGCCTAIIGSTQYSLSEAAYSLAFFVVVLPLWIFSLALSIRRVHDMGRSGVWLLLFIPSFLLPPVTVFLLVQMLATTELGTNKYGVPVKEVKFLDAILNTKVPNETTWDRAAVVKA